MAARQQDLEGQLREAAQMGEVLQSQLAGIEEQLGMVRSMVQEYQRAKGSLEVLKDRKRGDEVLLPLGGGQFVRANLADEGQVLSGIGSGYSVESPVADALRRVDAQIQSAQDAAQKLESEGQRVMAQMQALEDRIQQLTG